MAGLPGAVGSAVAKLIALYRREPAATQTAAAVVWGGWTMIDNAFIRHTGVFSWQIVVAAVVAAYGLLVRAQVIPVAKPPAPAPVPAPASPPAHP